jgi:hypothetical protein
MPIVIKTNISQKNSMIVKNFLPLMINYLNSFIIDNNSEKKKLYDSNIIYEWNYEIYGECLSKNKYRITVIEYDDMKLIGQIIYDWNISEEQIRQLYILNKINKNAIYDEIQINYKDKNYELG